jgi:hypothetical protein
MIGFPNRIDSCTLTGGSWVSTLPRDNIKNRTLGRVARSTNLLTTSTQFTVDMVNTKLVRLFAVVNHNFSLEAKYRLRGSNDATFSTFTYDSAWQNVWPAVYPSESVEWESDSWWTGTYSLEDIDGYVPNLVVVLPQIYQLRYWRLEIDDAANTAGYVQLGRVFLGEAWQPSKNASYGLSLGMETRTDVQESLSGAEYFQYRKPCRVTRFSLDYLSEDEGMANALEMDRRAGIDKEVFWIHDPDDTVHAIRRQFLGRFRQLSPVEFPYFQTNKKAYEIKELL